jgi:hypothetical protein
MKNFKVKDLMININAEKTGSASEHTKACGTCTQGGANTCGSLTCGQCTNNTVKRPHNSRLKHSIKAAELNKLKKAITALQKEEYA